MILNSIFFRKLGLLFCFCLSCACGDSGSVSQSELRPVHLPDLLLSEESVQQQLQEEYRKLQTLLQEPSGDSRQQGRAYGRMGQLFLLYDMNQPAEAALYNASRLMPTEPRWPYLLGYLYFNLGRYADAAQQFERARKLDADEPVIPIRLAETYLRSGRDKEAKSLLEKTIREHGRTAMAHFLLGQIAAAAGDFERAVKHYLVALKLQPEASSLHYSLGMAYRNLGRNAQDLELSLRHLHARGIVPVRYADPFLDDLRNLKQGERLSSSLGSIYMMRGQFAEAERIFAQVVMADSTDAMSWVNLGSVRAKLGKKDAAAAALQQALKITPQNSLAHMLLGQLYYEKKQTARAKRHFLAAIESDPARDEAHLGLARLLRQIGEFDAARQHYDRVLAINPGQVQARLQKAICFMMQNNFARARAVLEETYEVYPHLQLVRDGLVRLLAASPDSTVRNAQRALRIAQEPAEVKDAASAAEILAMALAANGRFAEAVTLQQEAIKIAQQEGTEAHLLLLQENLKKYRQQQPCRKPWAPAYDF